MTELHASGNPVLKFTAPEEVSSPPTVTVGIPTFNRPIGLERTLNCILNQTFTDLEILVSDNGSTDPAVKRVLDASRQDRRVKVVVQATNLGAVANFKFLLRAAQGTYFMWAADDDEWEPDFIEKCMLSVEGRSGVFCSMKVLYRRTGEISFHRALPLGEGAYQQATSFMEHFNSSMFYSLHKREDVLWWADPGQVAFDWFDCYLVLRNILSGRGYVLLSDDFLYTMGVDQDEYCFKPVNPRHGRLFEYYPLLSKCLLLILSSGRVKFRQKFSLVATLCLAMIDLFERYERPRTFYFLWMFLLRCCRWMLLCFFRLRTAIRRFIDVVVP